MEEQKRGFTNQKIQDKMLLLFEETGELAKAIRKTLPEVSIDYNKIENYTDIEEEPSDVLYYILMITNTYDIDLEKCFRIKEELNCVRYGHQLKIEDI